MFAQVARQLEVRDYLEVGSWLGGSAARAAEAFPQVESITCVDTWLGAAEHWIDQENPTHDLRWDDAGCSRLFDGFLRACRAVGMEHLVAPLRLPSSIAGRVLAHHGLSFDVIYLDGSHEAGDVFTDCRLFWPMCRGILVGDDWHDERFSVGRGVIRFLEVEGIPFHRLQLADGFWAVARGEEDGFNGSRPPAAIAVGCAVWF